MNEITARIAVTAQQTLNAYAKKHGIEVAPSMVNDVTAQGVKRLLKGDDERAIYKAVQWCAQTTIEEHLNHRQLINNMMASMASANSAVLFTRQAG